MHNNMLNELEIVTDLGIFYLANWRAGYGDTACVLSDACWKRLQRTSETVHTAQNCA